MMSIPEGLEPEAYRALRFEIENAEEGDRRFRRLLSIDAEIAKLKGFTNLRIVSDNDRSYRAEFSTEQLREFLLEKLNTHRRIIVEFLNTIYGKKDNNPSHMTDAPASPDPRDFNPLA